MKVDIILACLGVLGAISMAPTIIANTPDNITAQLKTQKNTDECVVEMYINQPIADDDEIVLMDKDDYAAYVDGSLKDFSYKDKDGAVSRISADKVDKIKILEE